MSTHNVLLRGRECAAESIESVQTSGTHTMQRTRGKPPSCSCPLRRSWRCCDCCDCCCCCCCLFVRLYKSAVQINCATTLALALTLALAMMFRTHTRVLRSLANMFRNPASTNHPRPRLRAALLFSTPRSSARPGPPPRRSRPPHASRPAAVEPSQKAVAESRCRKPSQKSVSESRLRKPSQKAVSAGRTV